MFQLRKFECTLWSTPKTKGELPSTEQTSTKTCRWVPLKLERKNYKQELNKLLRNYRATPHSTTRVAPATALFGRPMKTKLPEVTIPCSDPEIRECDRAAKAKIKKHADNKRYIKLSTVKEGDTVLVKRDDSKKKSDTPYDPRLHTVVEKKGSMVSRLKMIMASQIRETLPSSKMCPQLWRKTILLLRSEKTPLMLQHRCSPMPQSPEATHSVCEQVHSSLMIMLTL